MPVLIGGEPYASHSLPGSSFPNPWPPSGVFARSGESAPRHLIANENSHATSVHLFSIGRFEPSFLLRVALLDVPDLAVSIVRDFRELWLASKDESVQVALFHRSVGSFELEESARLVRSRWPRAKTLI